MENYIIIFILLLIVGGIVFYLAKAKKCGQKCIGCPYSRECCGKCTKRNTSNSNKED